MDDWSALCSLSLSVLSLALLIPVGGEGGKKQISAHPLSLIFNDHPFMQHPYPIQIMHVSFYCSASYLV